MAETDFEKWLRLGLGRAILFLQQNDSAPFRDALLYACLRDQRYDRQCDDTRGAYLYDLVQASCVPTFYQDRIIEALSLPPEEGTSESQRMEIVRYFAAAGDDVARKALYAAFLKNAQTRDYRGAGELIELEGIGGFETVLKTYLQTVGEDEDNEDVSYWIFILEERDGDASAQQQLKALAARNPAIGEWLNAIEAERTVQSTRNKRSTPPLTYEDLTRLIDEYCAKPKDDRVFASASRFRSYGRRTTKEALKRIASEIAEEGNEQRLLPMLRLFGSSTYPGEPAPLIALARHEDDAVAWAAMQALEKVQHPDARQLALELLQEPRYYGNAVDILTTNFAEGDYALIEPLMRQDLDDFTYHALGIALKNMAEEHPRPEAIPSLLLLYENGPCGLCRSGCVELLNQLGALPEDLRAECRYDAYPGTREWIAEQDAKG